MKYKLLSIVSFILPSAVHAYSITQTGWKCDGFIECDGSGVVLMITNNIVKGVLLFIGPLAVVVFFYGAISMITSQGQEGKEAGKKALIYASLGMVAAILTSAIIGYDGYVTKLIYEIGK